MPPTPLKTTRGCYGCGTENPSGLHIVATLDDDGRVRAAWSPRPEHRGLTTICHGGVLTAACDEMMGFAMAVLQKPTASRGGLRPPSRANARAASGGLGGPDGTPSETAGFAMAVYEAGKLYVTTHLTMQFKRPVMLGEPMTLEAWCTGRRGTRVFTRCRILGADGKEHAVARATFIEIPEHLRPKLVRGG